MKWVRAVPLEGFLWSKWGINLGRFSSVVSFNYEIPLHIATEGTFPDWVLHSHPAERPRFVPRVDFCMAQLNQWELDLTPFKTFDDYLSSLNRKQRCNYQRTEKCFHNMGCSFSEIEGDWSDYADRAYELYNQVASKYMQIYDRGFFHAIAKLPAYKLICAWQGEKLIGSLVMIEESTVVHSALCGLDYACSKKSFTYSKLHYEFLRLAIRAGRYKIADVGITADQAKKTLGFSPRSAVIDIFVPNSFLSFILRHSFSKFNFTRFLQH